MHKLFEKFMVRTKVFDLRCFYKAFTRASQFNQVKISVSQSVLDKVEGARCDRVSAVHVDGIRPVRTRQFESAVKNIHEDTAPTDTLVNVLSEVYELLELYGPSWYSEALRQRMQSALGRPDSDGKL
jgi:hypothetical protein